VKSASAAAPKKEPAAKKAAPAPGAKKKAAPGAKKAAPAPGAKKAATAPGAKKAATAPGAKKAVPGAKKAAPGAKKATPGQKPAHPTAPAAAKGPASKLKVPALKKKKGKLGAAKSVPAKFFLDCSEPVKEDIFDIASFEKFLHDRIKIGGKAGVLGDSIAIHRDGSQIIVNARIAVSKRYLKYLTKKFLKKQQLRDYIRVIARAKNNYYLRFFNFEKDEEEED